MHVLSLLWPRDMKELLQKGVTLFMSDTSRKGFLLEFNALATFIY